MVPPEVPDKGAGARAAAPTAASLDPDSLERDIRDFWRRHPGLDSRAEVALKAQTPEVQRCILDGGDLKKCDNPNTAVMGRIVVCRDLVAMERRRRAEPPGKEAKPEELMEELEEYIEEEGVDNNVAQYLRLSDERVLREVMDQGSLGFRCRNPSAVCFTRIRDAKRKCQEEEEEEARRATRQRVEGQAGAQPPMAAPMLAPVGMNPMVMNMMAMMQQQQMAMMMMGQMGGMCGFGGMAAAGGMGCLGGVGGMCGAGSMAVGSLGSLSSMGGASDMATGAVGSVNTMGNVTAGGCTGSMPSTDGAGGTKSAGPIRGMGRAGGGGALGSVGCVTAGSMGATGAAGAGEGGAGVAGGLSGGAGAGSSGGTGRMAGDVLAPGDGQRS